MRVRIAVLSCLFAAPIFAQQNELTTPMARYEVRLRLLSAEVKRDAFIMSQLVAATAQLNDFQITVAIDKAADHVKAAQKRAAEDPVAPQRTVQMLAFLQDPLLKHAREQGTMADLAGIRKEMLSRTGGLQSDLFRELDAARRERQSLMEIQTRLGEAGDQLDTAMMGALGSSFDFIRAGGK